jgi:hypothetical protein
LDALWQILFSDLMPTAQRQLNIRVRLDYGGRNVRRDPLEPFPSVVCRFDPRWQIVEEQGLLFSSHLQQLRVGGRSIQGEGGGDKAGPAMVATVAVTKARRDKPFRALMAERYVSSRPNYLERRTCFTSATSNKATFSFSIPMGMNCRTMRPL